MVFLGSRSHPEHNELDKTVAKSSGDNNAYTTFEFTNFGFWTPD